MTCQLSNQDVEKAVAFHGHSCPGLAIGIRAAEYALRKFSGTAADDLICVTETDMCGVDGIQFLTGCTFGKGNLIHLDYGKAAFSFYDRDGTKALRLLLRPDAMAGESGDEPDRQEIERLLMSKPLEEIFKIEQIHGPPPRGARILASLACDSCGESTMESRTRRFAGETLCIPCFNQVEQKI
ncbi:MAG: FmdE family protein [Desulfocapsaceae bacterium]|nr:FmdE family protein [Desulfocapsaceae bacterium]